MIELSEYEAERLLEIARQSFRLAAASVNVNDIEHHAGVGRDYLRRAHQAAELTDTEPSLWRKAGGFDE